MKRLLVAAAVTLLVLSATATAQVGVRAVGGDPASSAIGVRPGAASPDAALIDLAKSLAVALEDQEVRALIHQGVGRKFDGDYNVLYRDLANRRLADGSTFRGRLATAAAVTPGQHRTVAAALARIDGYAEALPRLQIAVPVRFDVWDVESHVPLVTYVPTEIDDVDLIEVPAYDSAGRVTMLDARVEPPMPVVVVSLNERTDDLGFIKAFQELLPECDPYFALESCDGGGGGGGGGTGGTTTSVCDPRTHSYGDKEILYQIKINNDHEPWISGSPEIYATYAFADSTGVKGKFYMSNVDDEGKWYTINGHLFYWQSYYGNVFVNAIWEEDGSDFGTFKYSVGGFSYTVNIKNGDDQLGYNPVSFHDPNCGYYSTGDAEFKMRHAAP